MKRILFGINDTKECRRAVECVLRLFDDREWSVTLLHIVPDAVLYADTAICDYGDDSEFDELFGEFESEFAKSGIKSDKLIKKGSVIDILLEVAKDYDLLVIGDSEASLLRKIFASNQSLFISASPIPILIAK